MSVGLESAYNQFLMARGGLSAELQSAVGKSEAHSRERSTAALDAWIAADDLSQRFLETVMATLSTAVPAAPMPGVLTPAMLAKRWGCSLSYVRSVAKTGHLKSFNIGSRTIRFKLKAVEEYEAAAASRANRNTL